ncbi:MAG TPA: hypothetical protein DEQ51_01235 [Alphaproteobacteria bacterium]|nr:hypothetical protein [Alphaproteobacteria bacterium]
MLDLFAAFDISDPAQILILLLGGILVLLLVLIILIAARGRPAPAAAAVSETAEPPSALPAEQVPATTTPDMPVAPPVDTSPPPADAEPLEDFRIFTRPKGAPAKPARPSSSAAADEQLSTTEHLRLIEKNMIRLRDLYQGGHITRDMYVDETRSLYHQARGLSSIS